MPDTAVFTTKSVFEQNHPILYVYHHLEDGAWECVEGDSPSTADYLLVSFQEIINHDDTVTSLSNLPVGYYAYRADKRSDWKVFKSL